MAKKNHAKSSKLSEKKVGSGFAAVLAVIMAIGIVVTWIVMFSKHEIPVALLPGLTFGMMIAVDVYVTTKKDVDVLSGICVGFLIANWITSFVGLCIDWEWELMDNELASGINIFVPVVYGMVRGRSIGQ